MVTAPEPCNRHLSCWFEMSTAKCFAGKERFKKVDGESGFEWLIDGSSSRYYELSILFFPNSPNCVTFKLRKW